jgi:hypothetical protein
MGSTARAALSPSVVLAAVVCRLDPPGMTVSTRVFQAPHDAHCPAHFGVLVPHCWQTYTDRLGTVDGLPQT